MGEISGQEGSWWKIGKPRWYVFERWTLTCKGAHCHGAESRFTTQNGFFLISNRFFKFSWKFSDCCSRVSSKQCLQLIIFFYDWIRSSSFFILKSLISWTIFLKPSFHSSDINDIATKSQGDVLLTISNIVVWTRKSVDTV